MLNYNYVYFDIGGFKNGKTDKDDYFYICTEDLRKNHYANVVTYPLDYINSYVVHYIAVLFNLLSIKYGFSFFERFLYPWYFKRKKTTKPLCFIVSGFYITPNYLRYLKRKYPNCKIVKIYRDSCILWRERNPQFTDEDMNLFDMSFSYDRGESEKYNMIHFNEIESKTEVLISKDYPIHDVFFAGAAKDRLHLLVDIYDTLEKQGVKSYYYLTNVKDENKVERSGICYSNHNMSYREMLYHTVNSKVILELNQGNIDGFTSRFLEAVIYNKKLITNNQAIKNSSYYFPEFINCIVDANDIDPEFVKVDNRVDYDYKDEFSPVHLIELIDKCLTNKYLLK